MAKQPHENPVDLLAQLTDAAYQTALRFDPATSFVERQLRIQAALRRVLSGVAGSANHDSR